MDRASDVLKDHLLDIQTKFIPLDEYSTWSFSKVFKTSIFFEIFDSMVSISSGSAAAKTIASTSLSPSFSLVGKETILLLKFFFIFVILFP